MSYTKHNFADGNVLTAAQLNEMETKIESNDYYIGANDMRWLSVFNKCLCVGDSLTEGWYDHNENGTTEYSAVAGKTYPDYMTKLYGLQTTNKGTGGATFQSWYEAHSSDDLSGHDLCIIELGGNDGWQGVTKATAAEYCQKIIDLVKTQNPGIKIFVCTFPSFAVATGSQYTYADVYAAISECASSNSDTYLIDLYSYSEIVSGSAYYQGSHLTAIGYMKMAKEIYSYACQLIVSYAAEFNNTQFIGTDYTYTS